MVEIWLRPTGRDPCWFRTYEYWANVPPTGVYRRTFNDALRRLKTVRSRALTTFVALSAAGALALTACSSSKGGGGGSSSKNAGGLGGGGNSSGNAASQTYKVGFIGALSGPNA